MNRKTLTCYESAFEFVIEKIIDFRRTVKLFITDYEMSMRNAIRSKFTFSKLSACFFHYAQAIRRKASKIPGFFNFLHVNSSAREIYYKIMYLALLPKSKINATYDSLKIKADEISHRDFELFLKYYHKQWITKEGADSFSVFGREIRTTCAAEGYNRVLSEYCQKHGSFIWFVASIRNQEFMKTNELREFIKSAGTTGDPQKKEYKVNNIHIAMSIFFCSSNLGNLYFETNIPGAS